MKPAVFGATLLVLGSTVPMFGHAQGYDQPSITIPMPNFGSNNREQQAEVRDQDRHCADLREHAADLRRRANHADDREDARRADDRLREIDDQLRHECSR
jgi:hypothetical protein